jgi:phosphoribosyl 1,2-cyclic phosphate phosphodiesterase
MRLPAPQSAAPNRARAGKRARVQAQITILGSGTSMGVPTLGCTCRVCTSTDPHDRRTRPSIAIQWEDHTVLVDTGPDFRQQALREGLTHVDAVLYTHSHADHILGLDDLRPLSFRKKERIPLYADDAAATVIERIFNYTFDPDAFYPTRARVEMHRLNASVTIHGKVFERVPLIHGEIEVAGFRFGNAAYLTDMSDIPGSSLPLLANLDVLIIDALRRKPHPSHATLDQALEFVRRIGPQRAFFTHMSHDLPHDETNRELPEHVQLAYDGLQIPFEI